MRPGWEAHGIEKHPCASIPATSCRRRGCPWATAAAAGAGGKVGLCACFGVAVVVLPPGEETTSPRVTSRASTNNIKAGNDNLTMTRFLVITNL